MRDVLASKITVPTLDADVISRDRLQAKLDHMQDFKLTVMMAGAGYGKTTTLVQYLAARDSVVGWYSLGPEDDNLYMFSIYLAAALDALYPGLKQWFCNQIEQEEGIDWKILFYSLMMGLEKFQETAIPGYLVIDDFQYALKEDDIRLFFGRFLASLPKQVHVILLSREYVNIPEVENMSIRGDMLEFLPTDFLFNLQETEEFLRGMALLSEDKTEAKTIFEQTEGWAIIVKLLANQWQKETDHFIRHLNNEDVAVSRVFEYLSQAIFKRQSPAVQDFLMRTAVVEVFDVDYCKTIVSKENAAALLDEVIKTGLFITRIGNDVYRYHSLFKEFLRHMANKHFTDIEALYKQIACYYQRTNSIELAVQFFTLSEEWQEVADILVATGRHWVNSGRQKLFREYMEQLPNKYRQNPELYLALGDAERVISDYAKAVYWYKLAEKEFKKRQDLLGWSQSCHSLGEVYLDIIQPDQAQRYLRQAYKLLPEGHDEEKGNLLYLMSENMINHGDSRRAERYWRLWLEVVPFDTADKNNLHARILLRTGRIDEVINLLEPKYKKEQQLRVPVSFRESALILSLCYAYKGDTEQALAYARASIRFANRVQATFTEAVGYARTAHALLLDYRHTKKLCLQNYDKYSDMVETLGVIRGRTELLQGRCLVQALEGNWQEAEQLALQGIKITEDTHDAWFTSQLYLTLAIAANLCGRFEDGIPYAEQGLARFGKCRDNLGCAACYWQLAYAYYQLKRAAEFEKVYQQLVTACNTYHCQFLLEKKSFLGDLTGFTSKPFEKYHKAITGSQQENKAVAPLFIKTLGGFKLFRNGIEVPEKEWHRKASKQLMFMLITQHGKPVARESFMAYLWPEASKKVTDSNFKVVLNQLITILEPDRKPRSDSSYILKQQSSLQLAGDERCQIDVVMAEQYLAEGLKLVETKPDRAMERLQQGLAMYDGDYLAGEYLDDDSLRERDRLQLLMLQCAEKLANLYAGQRDYEKAIQWANRILQWDNCWEQAYQIKLLCYGVQHDKALLERVYRSCEATLKNELGVEPSAKTTALYKQYK